jgi:microcystin-dependent protein
MPQDPFIGQIALFPYDFAPLGWAECDGRWLAKAQYQALFSLIGYAYGGDGTTGFALPDLRKRAAVGFGVLTGGGNYQIGQRDGQDNVTLTNDTIPSHHHPLIASSLDGDATTPAGNLLCEAIGLSTADQGLIYNPGYPGTTDVMQGDSIAPAGKQVAHNNMQPSLALRYCIALQGIYPQQ